MRLHRLELAGFGPFRTRQVVDFDAYAADGIFLIAGRTGAGKSSILDGVCFALYGGVPRYSSGEKRLRSDHCEPDDPTEVSLEATIAGRRLRVTRSPEYERPKLRGAGTTLEKHRAILEEQVDGGWQGIASGAAEVGRELQEIIGLTQDQFLQVVLLAQNRFAEFLHATVGDRRDVLRTLFGTLRYQQYAARLEDRRRDAEAEVAGALHRVRALLDEALRGDPEVDVLLPALDVRARLDAAERVVLRARYRAETLGDARELAAAEFTAAEREHTARERLARSMTERDAVRATLAALEQAAPSVEVDRGRHAAALDAEELRAAIESSERAATAARRAEEEQDAARAAVDPADAADPAAAVEELTGGLAAWQDAVLQEAALAEHESELAVTAERLAVVTASLEELDAQRALIPPKEADLRAALDADRVAAAGLPSAEAAVADLAASCAGARDAAKTAATRDRAETAHLQALDAVAAATGAVTALLRRRLADHAGELAAALRDGEPCAVCGAVEHPAPAAPIDEPVADADVERAEEAHRRAVEGERAAGAAASSARTAHAAAVERSRGRTVVEAEAALADARQILAAATAASERVAAGETELAVLVALTAEVEDARAALVDALAQGRDSRARLEERVVTARAAVAAARGDFASVTARVDAARDRLGRARRLAAAAAEIARSSAAARAADDELAVLVTASPFADTAEARAALLERGERERLGAAIADHDLAVRLETERLMQLELDLAGTEDGPIDVAGARARRDDARTAWTRAIEESTAAAQDAQRLTDLVARAAAAHDGVAELVERAEVVARLANTLAGRAPNTHRMDLESYVLAAELEDIVQAANLRLAEMSSGRYRLAHTDALAARNAASGLGLEIVDAFTGRARPTASLSGGETFLASLALALGLAEVVSARAGGMRLDTLFVDEGFGHLDAETLDLAMATLDELRQGGRTVGVISHVEAMKEQLTSQLVVEALPGGPSVIRQDVPASV